MPRPRPRTLAIGAFALLLAAAPLLPHGAGTDGFVPSGTLRAGAAVPAETAGPGRVTPSLRAEIDRVVDQGLALGRLDRGATPLVTDLVRCAELEGQRYCLHTGWTTRSAAEVRADASTALRTAGPAREETGDLSLADALRRAAALDPAARAAAERAELTRAARSVAKVWLLRHRIEGVALPAGFLADHPEARATTTTSPRATTQIKRQRDYPERAVILDPRQVADQTRTYWCGPASMQMLTWGWKGVDKGQGHWADELGTTSEGTAISDMVRVVNASTGWDRRDHAGPYITLDVSDYSFNKWMLLTMRHLVDYRAPLVLHPVLLKRFYPYLDDDASGHFQVGRGYSKRGDHPTAISYFEPWNQQRFDPSEPHINRVQWRTAYKSYRANQAHFQRNIGV